MTVLFTLLQRIVPDCYFTLLETSSTSEDLTNQIQRTNICIYINYILSNENNIIIITILININIVQLDEIFLNVVPYGIVQIAQNCPKRANKNCSRIVFCVV